MPKVSRFAEAFRESFNVVGLAGAAAASAALLNPLPLLVGLVAEAAYLLFVPDSRWYQARLERRHDAEVARRREQLKNQTFPMLRREMQERFGRLEAARIQIEAQNAEDAAWFQDVRRKLDYLLEKFLLFAAKEAEFRSYLRTALNDVRGERGGRKKNDAEWDAEFGLDRKTRRIPINQEPRKPEQGPALGETERWVRQAVGELQAHYDRDRAELAKRIEAEPDLDTKAVLEKRADVLERRHESAEKMGKILVNLHHQLELLEDTFGLINDQIRARSPEQVLADIDSVVWQTDSMTRLLEELAPLEQMAGRIAG